MSLRVRSLAVSLASTVLDAGLFAVCTLFWAGGVALLIARWVCGALGAAGNFSLNRAWAFGARRQGLFSQAARYTLTAVISVSLATGLWWLLVRLTGWDPRLIHLLSLGLVWLGFTFPLLRSWVFASQRLHC